MTVKARFVGKPIAQFSLTFDRDYGIDKQTGWTVTANGIVLTQFEPGPLRALWRGYRSWLNYRQADRDWELKP